MTATNDSTGQVGLVPLPEEVPVVMPELPEVLVLATPEQLKALGDPMRTKITHLIQHQPATAKQIADRLGASPGAVGHHLHVLEKAGLVQIVALRLVRGTVAKYFARTARMYGFPQETIAPVSLASPVLNMITEAREEVQATLATGDPTFWASGWFPHARISDERMLYYAERIEALIFDFLREPTDPQGHVQGLSITLFTSPPAYQAQAEVAGNNNSE